MMSSSSRAAARSCAAALLALAGPGALVAQDDGRVSGVLTILEREGARTGDLSNAVVWLEPAPLPGVDSGPAAAAAATAPISAPIVMERRQYVPRVQVLVAGSRAEFPNRDPFRHNVFSKSGPTAFDLGLYARGETKGVRLDRPGVYPVFCNIHAQMLAFVVVVPSRWVAQPSPDGRFTIAGVPDGPYVLRAWHDRGGELRQALAVQGGAVARLQLDARQFHRVPHSNKFGQPYTSDGRERY